MRWLVVAPLLLFYGVTAQDRCGTDYLPQNLNSPEGIEKLQDWITDRVQAAKQQKQSFFRQVIFEVPVVFHIIHNGESIGTESNLSDERILEQLQILNQDFRRQNADAILTPTVYQSVAADVEINFVMARRDPEGLSTPGITRTQGPLTSYSDDAAVLSAIIQWPPEDVVNIYVAPLSESLGFAKFPYSTLSGMESRFNPYREVDGIFINYKYVGNSNATNIDFESKGRTVTHEMGHYFGLLHVFQDCGDGDFCEDTPVQSVSTNGCPSNKTSCNTPDMIQNYLDYTDDVCMNLFTLCQRDRMRAVLQSSPRRASLLSSKALLDPIQVANDLGIKEITAPKKVDCTSNFQPEIQLRNTGTNTITSFRVGIYINNILKEEQQVTSQNLAPLDLFSLNFSTLTLDDQQINTVRFTISSVNGSTDGNPENNSMEVELPAGDAKVLPYILNFENTSTLQAETELGTETKWQLVTAPNVDAQNFAFSIPFYNNPVNYGIKDFFFTPLLDVSNVTSLQMNFKYAYAPNANGSFLDGLLVIVSEDCGQTFTTSNYALEKYRSSLTTASATNGAFIPSGPDDWEPYSLNLTPYLNGGTLQIAIGGVNGGGNNLYVDDIEITSGELVSLDLGIREVTKVSPVTCRSTLSPVVTVKNFGYLPITSFNLVVNQNGTVAIVPFDGLNIVSGASKSYNSGTLTLNEGANSVSFSIINLNGELDLNDSNDSFQMEMILNGDEESLPLKETFDELNWTITERNDEPLFEIAKVNSKQVLQALAYDSGSVGSRTYLVSPIFKTGVHKEAAIRFRYAYANRPGYTDNLKIVLSKDCGATYDIEVLNWSSSELSATQSLNVYVPESDEDWKTGFVDISEHLIWGTLRAALIFTNGNGNNLYLDDVEVILNSDPDLPVFTQRFEVYPIPAIGKFNIAMNLPEKETVRIRVIDMSGKAVFDKDFPNTLNQTYELLAPSQSGFYLIQVIGNQVYQYRRIYIGQ